MCLWPLNRDCKSISVLTVSVNTGDFHQTANDYNKAVYLFIKLPSECITYVSHRDVWPSEKTELKVRVKKKTTWRDSTIRIKTGASVI